MIAGWQAIGPCVNRGGDLYEVPDFLPAGPSDVLVPSSLLEEAKQVLEDTTGPGSYVP